MQIKDLKIECNLITELHIKYPLAYLNNDAILRLNSVDYLSVYAENNFDADVAIETLADIPYEASVFIIAKAPPKMGRHLYGYDFKGEKIAIIEALTNERFIEPKVETFTGTVKDFCATFNLGKVAKKQERLVIDSASKNPKGFFDVKINNIPFNLFPQGYGGNKWGIFLVAKTNK